MPDIISIGCLIGLMLGIWLSYSTPPSSGDSQNIGGTFAKIRRYMK